MGADFSAHHVFAGDDGRDAVRAACAEVIRAEMARLELGERDEVAGIQRGFVIGPPGRWIFVGDSAGTLETLDEVAFGTMARALSAVGPVVDILVSDDAAVHFLLYRDGDCVDRVGNLAFPCNAFPSQAESDRFRGHPRAWYDLAAPDAIREPQRTDGSSYDPRDRALRDAWSRGRSGWRILQSTIAVLGLDPELATTGYTHDEEGIPHGGAGHWAPTSTPERPFEELWFGEGGPWPLADGEAPW